MNDQTTALNLHWLTAAVAHGGAASGMTPEHAIAAIPAGTSTEDAWAMASDAFGLSEERLAELVAEAYRLELAATDGVQPEVGALIPVDIARFFGIVPLRHSHDFIAIATANPLDDEIELEVARITGRTPRLAVAGPSAIRAAQDQVYGMGAPEDAVLSRLDLSTAMREVELPATTQTLASRNSAVEQLVRLILFEAVKAGADLIRFEPRDRGGKVGFRIGSEYKTFVHLPLAAILSVMVRLRHWMRSGQLDHDGRIVARIDGERYDFHLQLSGLGALDPIGLTVAAPNETPPTVTLDDDIDQPDRRRRALVVDDEPGDRLLLRTMLTRSGIDVIEAVDGVDALEKLQGDQEIDVVLLDHWMPRMSGLEVLDRMRSTVRMAGMPVMVITASTDPEVKRRLLSAGADDYLQKPINTPRVAERVKALLRRSLSTP